MHDCLGAYEAFTAAMTLRYALTRTVCNLSAEARTHYTGGLTIPPRPSLQLEGPVAVFDSVSVYPSTACIINAAKDTYVAEGGHWDLGEGLGGFSTVRPGSLAAELRERLEERLRFLDDPAMQTRATFLKQIINTMVGMSRHKTNPYSDTRVTGCITATGRRLLEACHRSVFDLNTRPAMMKRIDSNVFSFIFYFCLFFPFLLLTFC